MSAVTADTIPSEPLFTSAFQAVRFAITRDGRFGRPLFAKLIVSEGESFRSRGLSPYEAAAQAGMIIYRLRTKLKRVQFSTLLAKTAPPVVTCTCRRPCCSGKMTSVEWGSAVSDLVEAAFEILPDADRSLREELIVKMYGRGQPLTVIARTNGVELDELERQYRTLVRWLLGSRAKGGVSVEGVEPAAWREAETVLRSVGIVG